MVRGMFKDLRRRMCEQQLFRLRPGGFNDRQRGPLAVDQNITA